MRRLVFALALVVGGGAAIYFFSPVDEVGAAPAFEVETFFFSDPGMTQEIGWRFRGCTGPLLTEGSTSSYRLTYRGDPCSTSTGGACYICYAPVDPNQGPVPTHRVTCSLMNAEFAGYPEC